MSKHSHYHKDVSHLKSIDVYRVLELFDVTNPCIQHAVKKLLVAGGRGAGKDFDKDIQEAIDSLERLKAMKLEDDKWSHTFREEKRAYGQGIQSITRVYWVTNGKNRYTVMVRSPNWTTGLFSVFDGYIEGPIDPNSIGNYNGSAIFHDDGRYRGGTGFGTWCDGLAKKVRELARDTVGGWNTWWAV